MSNDQAPPWPNTNFFPVHFNHSSSNDIAIASVDEPRPDSARADVAQSRIKHRRSRMGCMTCRLRRVKCDEKFPSCDRCHRSDRTCIYTTDVATKRAQSDEKIDDSDVVTVGSAASVSPRQIGALSTIDGRRRSSDVTSLTVSKSPSAPSASITEVLEDERDPSVFKVFHKDPKICLLLNYRVNHMSHYHYGLCQDSHNFVATFILEQALKFEPLLYALVAFVAYHRTMLKPDGAIEDFLPYYSKALLLLWKSLQKEQEDQVAVLLTMLQLAVLEEHLSDWVNLLTHQKAALKILLANFDPVAMVQDPMLNKMLELYIRIDLFAGVTSGRPLSLSRKWPEAQHNQYQYDVRLQPDNLFLRYEEKDARQRLIAYDFDALFNRLREGQISLQDFDEANVDISDRCAQWYNDIDPSIFDPQNFVKEPDQIDDSNGDDQQYAVRKLSGNIWRANFMVLRFWVTDMVIKMKPAQARHQPVAPDVSITAHKVSQMFDAIDEHDPAPGAMYGSFGAFGVACIILGKDPSNNMMCREKLARVEAKGYIIPLAMRKHLSDAWGIDVTGWWLPEDEGLTPMIRVIRDFSAYRVQSEDPINDDMRNLNGLFSALQVNQGESEEKTRQLSDDLTNPIDALQSESFFDRYKE